MRSFLLIVLLFAFAGCDKPFEEKPLNVIIVLIDDMGYGDISAHGNPLLKTPNFDKLHDECVRFTNFAVSPTCAPTRAAIMTGSHEFLVGVTHTISPMNLMDTDAITIAELFQTKGYKTGLYGKWHLGQNDKYGPWFRGFDETLTVPDDKPNSHFDPVLLHNRNEKKYRGYREDILFQQAMKFMKNNQDSAFFCYIATYSPHTPNKVSEKYSKPYKGYTNPNRPDGEYRSGFFGQVANVDENLGKLQLLVDSLGIADNTLLVVLNDNGGTMGVDTYNSGMRGVKTTPYWGGTRAFSFWKWGDHFPTGDRNLMSGHVDIFPTLADLCGLDITNRTEKQLQGNSLKKVLENIDAKLDDKRMQVHHIGRWTNPKKWEDHKYAGCCIRWGNYILVRHEPCEDTECRTCVTARRRGIEKTRPLYTSNSEHYVLTTPGEWKLFDIQTDPCQENNLADENPLIVKKMSDFYEDWWEKVVTKLKKKNL
ncbi:MAG: sulfatase-like hydrolase/transferase [Draconibacterium sp.]|nr:sulfatase-like hydrolase/transferase [Draconibacterium sp.]